MAAATWVKDNGFAFIQGLAIGGVAAFIAFFMLVKDPLPLDPFQAYCRGAVDLIAYSRVSTGQPFDDQIYDENFVLCMTDAKDGVDLPGMKGPILPTYAD